MSSADPVSPPPWFKRPVGRDVERITGTNGAAIGMKCAAGSALIRAYLTIAALTAAIDTVDVFTVLSDSTRYGARLAAWEPIVWEGTSGIATLAVCGIAYQALRLAMPGRAPWRTALLVHVLGSLLFSLSHVGLMTGARTLIYAGIGSRYRFAISDWPYEYRKDLLAYVLLAAIFWFFARERDKFPSVDDVDPAFRAPKAVAILSSTFDIIDGSSFRRVAHLDICAIHAAGNYVEFHLADGGTPLMRTSLRQIEEELSPHGMVRTHRSWIVNAHNISAIETVGSGDYMVALRNGIKAPLSRRYPTALQALRR